MIRRLCFLLALISGCSVYAFSNDSFPADTLRYDCLIELLAKGDSCDLQADTYHAMIYYEEALKIDTISCLPLRKVAQCQYKRGQYTACLASIATLADDSITYQDIKLKSLCYANLEMNDSLLYWGRIIAERYPFDGDNITKLAQQYNATERPDSALFYTINYRQYDSTNVFVNRQYAFALYTKKEYENALNVYRSLLQAGDKTASTHYYTGMCFYRCDSLDQAYDHLFEATRLFAFKNPHTISQLGMVCIENGSAHKGVEYLQEAVNLLQPDDNLMFTLNNAIANGYYKRRMYTDCIKYLKESLQYMNTSANTVYKIAQVYGTMKDMDTEKKYYQRFIEMVEKRDDPGEYLIGLLENARERLTKIREEEFMKGTISE